MMKTKTGETLARSSSSSYITTIGTTSPKSSQLANSFCYRHLKTNSDYY